MGLGNIFMTICAYFITNYWDQLKMIIFSNIFLIIGIIYIWETPYYYYNKKKKEKLINLIKEISIENGKKL